MLYIALKAVNYMQMGVLISLTIACFDKKLCFIQLDDFFKKHP